MQLLFHQDEKYEKLAVKKKDFWGRLAKYMFNHNNNNNNNNSGSNNGSSVSSSGSSSVSSSGGSVSNSGGSSGSSSSNNPIYSSFASLNESAEGLALSAETSISFLDA
jgi:hypothetical protein